MFRNVGLALIAFTALPTNGTRQPAHSPESISMVGRGVISTAAPEFALTVTPDGSELYFDRASADRRTFAIMVSRRTGTGWGEPDVVPFSGTWRDADPFITPDGKRLYFSSNRPRANGRDSSFNTWYVERQGSGWSSPIDPGSPLNSDSTDIFVSATRSGDVVFSSARQGPSRIYRASPNGSSWSEPVALELTPSDGLSNPAISPDGRLLVLARPVPGGPPLIPPGPMPPSARPPTPAPSANPAPGAVPQHSTAPMTPEELLARRRARRNQPTE